MPRKWHLRVTCFATVTINAHKERDFSFHYPISNLILFDNARSGELSQYNPFILASFSINDGA